MSADLAPLLATIRALRFTRFETPGRGTCHRADRCRPNHWASRFCKRTPRESAPAFCLRCQAPSVRTPNHPARLRSLEVCDDDTREHCPCHIGAWRCGEGLGYNHGNETPLSYFHGMTVTSDWQPGSTITMRLDEMEHGHTRKFWDVAICGEVLAADPPHRLSYTLGEQSDPTVYVTWELRSVDGLTIVRLYIDEPDEYPGSEDNLDIIWLPILSPLAENLNEQPSNRASRIAPRLTPIGSKTPRPPRTSIDLSAGQSLRKGAFTSNELLTDPECVQASIASGRPNIPLPGCPKSVPEVPALGWLYG
jgi:hypothetical protein